jgi:hypothetical protein
MLAAQCVAFATRDTPAASREMLEFKDGKLMAKKSGKDLPSVLGSHCGTRQSQREIEALIEAVSFWKCPSTIRPSRKGCEQR